MPESGNRIRQHPAWRFARPGFGVNIRAAFDEKLDHFGMVFPYRHHQGRLLKRRIPGIDFGPAIEKHLDRVDVAGVRSGHQGGLSRWIGRIRIRTGIEQQPDHGGVPIGTSKIQRRHAIAVRKLRVRPSADQQTGCLQVIHADQPV